MEGSPRLAYSAEAALRLRRLDIPAASYGVFGEGESRISDDSERAGRREKCTTENDEWCQACLFLASQNEEDQGAWPDYVVHVEGHP